MLARHCCACGDRRYHAHGTARSMIRPASAWPAQLFITSHRKNSSPHEIVFEGGPDNISAETRVKIIPYGVDVDACSSVFPQ